MFYLLLGKKYLDYCIAQREGLLILYTEAGNKCEKQQFCCLKHMGINIADNGGGSKKEIYGVLIEIASLWEKYLNRSLVKDISLKKFFIIRQNVVLWGS